MEIRRCVRTLRSAYASYGSDVAYDNLRNAKFDLKLAVAGRWQ